MEMAQFFDNFNSGLVESKNFAYQQQIRGRVDCSVDHANANNYTYEK